MSADPDPYSTLETPEALDRAMRLVHARRGTDEVYRKELGEVSREIQDEVRVALGDPADDEEVGEEAYALHAWKMTQLVHALVRVSSVATLNASAMSREPLKVTPQDVLKLIDDALRPEVDAA